MHEILSLPSELFLLAGKMEWISPFSETVSGSYHPFLRPELKPSFRTSPSLSPGAGRERWSCVLGGDGFYALGFGMSFAAGRITGHGSYKSEGVLEHAFRLFFAKTHFRSNVSGDGGSL